MYEINNVSKDNTKRQHFLKKIDPHFCTIFVFKHLDKRIMKQFIGKWIEARQIKIKDRN